MDEVQVDIEEGRLAGLLVDNVLVPDFLKERSRRGHAGLNQSSECRISTPLPICNAVGREVTYTFGPRRYLANERARDTRRTQMPRGVKEGSKRHRQYEHIKDSYKEKGVSTKEAKERAARTVNKQKSKK